MKMRMKMNNKLVGLCVAIPIILSGCGNHQAAQTNRAAESTPAAQSTAAVSSPAALQGQNQTSDQKQSGQPKMSETQRQMFGTFRSMIMMDKVDGLTITKEEAQSMLPTAQDIVTKAEMTDDSKAKLLEKLTDAQKKYVEDEATKMNNRGNGGGNGKANANGNNSSMDSANAGNAAKSTDSSAQTNAAKDPGKDQGQPPQGKGQGAPNANGANGNGNGNPPGGEMKDPGKQLIELLQSKLK